MVDILLTCIDIDIRASGGSSPFVLELLSNFCLALYTVELMAIIFVKRVQVFQDRVFPEEALPCGKQD